MILSKEQIYTGYLFKNKGGLEGVGQFTYTITGYFQGFSGTGATAQKDIYGWYAQVGKVS